MVQVVGGEGEGEAEGEVEGEEGEAEGEGGDGEAEEGSLSFSCFLLALCAWPFSAAKSALSEVVCCAARAARRAGGSGDVRFNFAANFGCNGTGVKGNTGSSDSVDVDGKREACVMEGPGAGDSPDADTCFSGLALCL